MDPQRLDLSYDIIWEGRWHVGSGYQSAAVDRLLRRFGGVDGVPFVPGSQIKGVLRYQCERLAVVLGLEVVNPHAVIEDDKNHLVRFFKPLRQSPLIVDRLFGSRYQGECLYVTNAGPVLPKDTTNTSIQTRTAMDRLTGTVMEQHLFTTEFSERNVRLQGSIRARHPAGVLTQDGDEFPYEYALLFSTLLALDSLGGDKSAGMGRCKIKINEESLCWNGDPISLDDALLGFQEALSSFQGEEWIKWIDELRMGATS